MPKSKSANTKRDRRRKLDIGDIKNLKRDLAKLELDLKKVKKDLGLLRWFAS